MPIVTHEDEVLLARLDVDIANTIRDLGRKIASLSDHEKRLADQYNDYTKALTDYLRKMKDKHKQMDTLAREDKSGIHDADVKEYKKRVDYVDEQIKMFEGYYDRMKDLALQKKTLIKKMEEYADMVVATAKIRKNIIDLGLKIEKDKDKMVAADNLNKREDALKDAEREFERSRKETEKKWDLWMQERQEVNGKWKALKDIIDEFE